MYACINIIYILQSQNINNAYIINKYRMMIAYTMLIQCISEYVVFLNLPMFPCPANIPKVRPSSAPKWGQEMGGFWWQGSQESSNPAATTLHSRMGVKETRNLMLWGNWKYGEFYFVCGHIKN